MNINVNYFNYTLVFLKENIFPSFTARQKEIFLIASIAFGLIAASWYIASRCLFTGKKIGEDHSIIKPEIEIEQKNPDAVPAMEASLLPSPSPLLAEANANLVNEIELVRTQKRKISHGDINQIFESIYLGNLAGCEDWILHANQAPEHKSIIISVCDSEPSAIPANVERLVIKMAGDASGWSSENGLKNNLKSAFQWIDKARTENVPVLIHCECGQSRSCSLLICYLMWSTGLSYEIILPYIKSKRTFAHPSPELKTVICSEFQEMLNHCQAGKIELSSVE